MKSYKISLLAAAVMLCVTAAVTDANSAGPRPVLQQGGAPEATKAQLQGRLELTWGDAKPGSKAAHRFSVTLVDDAGVRHALDAGRALKAAGDLYSLNKSRVAVTLEPQSAMLTKAASGLSVPEVIVPIDDLVSNTVTGTAGEFSTRVVTTTWATLMCKFKDIATEQKPKSFFQSQYGTATGELGQYWSFVSYGNINLNGSTAYGWFTLPQNRSFYVTSAGANLDKLFDDCTAAANASVNFAANGGLQGINMMFNGDLDGYAWGGGRCATLDGINKCWSSTWNPPWAFQNLAPLAHEMGHAYGLPHANNSDGDSDTYDNPWDVMSDAYSNANTSTTYGTLPKNLNVYSRNRLGYLTAARKRTINHSTTSQRFELAYADLFAGDKTRMVTLVIPGTTTRYYTIEARGRRGTYDGNLAGNAVIIHSVDTARASPAWSVDADSPKADVSNNEGSMFKVGESWSTPEASGKKFRVQVINTTTEGFTIDVVGQ